MLSKKCLIISTLLALSFMILAGCAKGNPNEIPALSRPGEGAGEFSVTVYVLTVSELTEIVVEYYNYTSWAELIDCEFDGSEPARAEAHWRGDYIIAVGNLRPEKPSGIVVYLNGVYSDRFVSGCAYEPGYTLAFVEPGADIEALT